MGAFLWKHLDDFLLVIGCAAIAYGAYLIHPVAAWIVGGVECIVLSFLVGAGQTGENS